MFPFLAHKAIHICLADEDNLISIAQGDVLTPKVSGVRVWQQTFAWWYNTTTPIPAVNLVKDSTSILGKPLRLATYSFLYTQCVQSCSLCTCLKGFRTTHLKSQTTLVFFSGYARVWPYFWCHAEQYLRWCMLLQQESSTEAHRSSLSSRLCRRAWIRAAPLRPTSTP